MALISRNHPFAVEAFFKRSLVLTYAVPQAELKELIPPCLELDTFNNQWAFVAVALVDATQLRPKGFPKIFGNDFFLIGFRIFVRYTTTNGKNLRGLYILKSETNKRKMAFLGNLFTRYSYATTDIVSRQNAARFSVSSRQSALEIEIGTGNPLIALPEESPFKDWKEARRYAGPLPFTFSFDAKTNEVLIIEGVRESWIPKPVEVIKSNVGFIKQMNLKDMVLANAFLIENIPYHWKKGRKEQWIG
jgi:hypothetical protein